MKNKTSPHSKYQSFVGNTYILIRYTGCPYIMGSSHKKCPLPDRVRQQKENSLFFDSFLLKCILQLSRNSVLSCAKFRVETTTL